MNPAQWVQRCPLMTYFMLAYGISWGGILVLLAFRKFDFAILQLQDKKFIFVLMLLGPSASSWA